MARIRNLSAPPIQEAVIDFVIDSRPLDESELRKLAKSIAGPEWVTEDVRAISATFDVADLKSFSGSDDFEGVRVKAPGDTVIVVYRANRVTVSNVKSYRCWEDLQALAFESLKKFAIEAGDAVVSRVGTRFINLLKPLTVLADMMTAPPTSPLLGAEVTDFLERKILKFGESGITANVTIGTVAEGPDETTKAILVDIDASSAVVLRPDDPALAIVLGELRSTKNSVFFGAVTEAALESYE